MSEQTENGLGDFLRDMGVPHLPQGGGINEVDVAIYNRRECIIRHFWPVTPQLFDIIRNRHSPR